MRGSRVERAIAALSTQQKGLLTRRQLLGLGVTPSAIDHRLKAGRLVPIFRGVYFTGHGPLPERARELAATLAYVPHGLVSRRSAAVLWLLIQPAPAHPIDVTVPRGRGEGQAGIRLHHVRELHRDEVRRLDGIPVTTPARTLLDLAGDLRLRQLEQALAEAQARRLVSRPHLLHLLDRYRGRPGTPALRHVVGGGTPALTHSEAEERLLALVRRAGLPEPAVNARVGRYEVDFLWREQRLIVEIDDFAFHSSRTAFERDRARDAALQAEGWRVVRFTWRRLVEEPERLVAMIAALLATT